LKVTNIIIGFPIVFKHILNLREEDNLCTKDTTAAVILSPMHFLFGGCIYCTLIPKEVFN